MYTLDEIICYVQENHFPYPIVGCCGKLMDFPVKEDDKEIFICIKNVKIILILSAEKL